MTYENVCLHNMNYENMNKSIWKMKYIMSIRNTWIKKSQHISLKHKNYEKIYVWKLIKRMSQHSLQLAAILVDPNRVSFCCWLPARKTRVNVEWAFIPVLRCIMGNGRNQVDGVELNNNLVHINFINISPLSNRLIYFLNNKKTLAGRWHHWIQ